MIFFFSKKAHSLLTAAKHTTTYYAVTTFDLADIESNDRENFYEFLTDTDGENWEKLPPETTFMKTFPLSSGTNEKYTLEKIENEAWESFCIAKKAYEDQYKTKLDIKNCIIIASSASPTPKSF